MEPAQYQLRLRKKGTVSLECVEYGRWLTTIHVPAAVPNELVLAEASPFPGKVVLGKETCSQT